MQGTPLLYIVPATPRAPPGTSGTEHGAVAGVELQTKVHTKHRNHGEGP